MIDIIHVLIILGAIMLLGFIGNLIFNRTQIPSIVWLLFFGLIIGFIFQIQETIPESILKTISSFVGAVAIIIILFDGGINTKLYQLFKGAPRGFLLSISTFLFSILATMIVVVIISATMMPAIPFENSMIVGLILGAIIAGTSSPIVIPLAIRLKNLQDKTKTALSIESIITDPLCIVVVLAISYMIIEPGAGIDLGEGAKSLVSTFSVGAVVGAVLGLFWLPIMHRVRKEQYSYVVTLAVVFLIYSLTESWWGGAGAISCLMFGLVLGNGKKILKTINYTGTCYEVDVETKQFHALTSFIIRTFFFVYLGMLVSFQKIEYIFIGIIILIILFVIRYLAIFISTYKGGFEKDDKQTMLVMMPRGLAAAILAIIYGPSFVDKLMPGLDGFFKDTAFVVILGTAIICTIGVSIIANSEKKKQENNRNNDINKLIGKSKK